MTCLEPARFDVVDPVFSDNWAVATGKTDVTHSRHPLEQASMDHRSDPVATTVVGPPPVRASSMSGAGSLPESSTDRERDQQVRAGGAPLLGTTTEVQLPLPALAALISPSPGFAHPFEHHFADLLDSYRIRWRYEPTTFLLARRADGSLAEGFTPDFYLPDLRTYVELTSMRQPLVTRKHRKLRRFRGAFPDIRVVMLYRRDYHRMLSAWSGMSARSTPAQLGDLGLTAGRLLYADQTLNSQLDEHAFQMALRYEGIGEQPLLVGLGHGGRRVAADLASRLAAQQLTPEVDSLVFDIRDGRTRGLRQGSVRLSGRTVTLVAPMLSTGLTTEFAAGWLRRRGTVGVDVCALLDRASARIVSIPLRYASLPAPIEHLVGYGLDLRHEFRHLTSVSVLDDPYDGPRLAGGRGS